MTFWVKLEHLSKIGAFG